MVRNIVISTCVFFLSIVACETINQLDDTYTPAEKLVPIPTPQSTDDADDDDDDENDYYPDCEDWELIEA